MNHVFPRLAALLIACSFATGCAADAASDEGTISADETSALLAAGTYTEQGEPTAWTIKQLVLRADKTYTVEMYPGRAFPIEHTSIIEGKYTQTEDKLTLKFAKGNDFNSWTIEKKGSTFELTDTEEDTVSTLKHTSDSTTFDPGPLQGKDPGKPTRKAGQAALSCHSGTGDIWINAVLAEDATGTLWVSSEKDLELPSVDKVTLHDEYPNDEDRSDEWIHAEGAGKVGYEPRRYIIDVKTDFIVNGGEKQGVTISIGSAEYESEALVAWGFDCSSTGI